MGRNPADAVTAPRPDRKEMKTFGEDQVRQLFEATEDDRLHALWVLLATTGLRLGEAIGLRWQDIDLQAQTLTVRSSLQRQKEAGIVFVEPQTRTSRRSISLPDGTVAALQAHRSASSKRGCRPAAPGRTLTWSSAAGTAA